MFGNPGNTAGFGGGGLFGGAGQNTGGGLGLGGQPQQNQLGGGFGNSTGGFGGGQQPNSLFGGGQNAATTGLGGGFGGGNAGFGQGGVGGQQPSGIGGTGQTASVGGFGAPQQNATAGFGAQGGLFGNQNKSTSVFGGNTQGAAASPFQSQNNTTQGFGAMGGGGFGQAGTSQGLFGGNNQNQFGNNAPGAGGVGGAAAGTTKFNQAKAEQQLVSLNQPFQLKDIQQDDGKGGKQNLRFRNIRAEDRYSMASVHMLRLHDKMAQGGQTQENPEWKAQQEWTQRQQQYPLLQKIQGGGQQGAGAGMAGGAFGQQASSGFRAQAAGFGGATTGLGGATQGFGAFGQTQQPNLFGGNQTNNNAPGSLLGQNAGQQNNQQTQGLGFGQNNASQGFGGGLGQQQPNAAGGGLLGLNKQPTSMFGNQTTAGAAGGIGGAQGGAQTSLFGGQQPAGATSGIGGTTGGLFGSQSNTQAPGGGLFGNAGGGGQAAGGGLFGNNPPQQQPQQQPAGGLFGGASQSTGLFGNGAQGGGGLFGGGNTQAAQPSTGGLFGQNPTSAAPSTGGLFGNSAQQPAAGAGLFGGNAQPSQSQGGLFGKTASTTGGLLGGGAAGGGLFGNAGQQNKAPAGFGQQPGTSTSGGLFGAQPGGGTFGAAAPGQTATQTGLFGAGAGAQSFGQQPGGGLFGGGAAQPSQGVGGGLFGGSAAPPSASTGLIVGAAQQPLGIGQNLQGMHQHVMPGMLQSANADPYGLAGGFLEEENPVLPFDEELERMKKDARLLDNRQANTIQVKTEFGLGGGVTTSFDFSGLPLYSMSHQLCQRPSEADLEEESRYLAKQEMKQRSMYEPNPALSQRRYTTQTIKQTFSLGEGYKTQNTPNAGISPLLRKNTSESGQKSRHQELNRLNDAQGFKPDADLSRSKNREDYRPRKIEEYPDNLGTQNVKSDTGGNQHDNYRQRDLIYIQARLQAHSAGNERDKICTVPIHKSRYVSDIWEHIAAWLERDNIPTNDFRLLYGRAALKASQTLAEAGITDDCEVDILVAADDPVARATTENRAAPPIRQANSLAGSSSRGQARFSSEFCPEDMLPRQPKEGYKTEPSWTSMARMTLEQLRQLPEFSISNEHGCIKFCPLPSSPGLDLTEVDLASAVNITSKNVAVYEQLYGQPKPEVGQKLNVPAIITLYEVPPRKGEDAAVKEEKLRRGLERGNERNDAVEGGAQQISYDHDTYEWVFKVPHFSKWGAESDDEDEAAEAKQDQRGQQDANMNQGNQQPGTNTQYQTQSTGYQASAPGQPAFISQRTEKPFETRAEPVRVGAHGLRYGSSAYRAQSGVDEQVVLRSAVSQGAGAASGHGGAINQGQGLSQLPQQKLMAAKYSRKVEVLERIKERKKVLSDVKRAAAARPSNAECKAKLVQLGVRPSPYHMPMRGVRPCFRPPTGQGHGADCQLLTFHSSNKPQSDGDTSTKVTLRLHSLRVQSGKFCDRTDALPDFAKVLLQHVEIQDLSAHRRSQSLGKQRDNHLTMDGSSAWSGRQIQPNDGQRAAKSRLSQSLHKASKTANFESNFYQRLFSETKIPQTYQRHDPSDIFQYLKDVALEYINTYKSTSSQAFCKKLEREFYVVCMLNALFGDPRLHLIQLHPGFTSKNGMDNFEKATGIYAEKRFSDVKDSFETGKQRRNAVTELLRFICSREFSVDRNRLNMTMKDDEELYGVVLQMLMNGEVVAAVRLLSKCGKHNLALCLSQAVSSQSSTKQRIKGHAVQLDQGNSLGSNFRKIINLVTGSADNYDEYAQKMLAPDRSFKISWQQALCSHLLYAFEPGCSFKAALEQFMGSRACVSLTEVRNSGEDLLFVLLRMYTCVKGQNTAAEKLRTFKNMHVTPEASKTQEFHVQWLVQHVLRLYSRFENELRRDDGPSAEQTLRKIGVIECRNYDQTCSSYINQLIRTKKCREALTVCMMIENIALKKRLIFETLSLITQMMLEKSHQEKAEMDEFIHDTLQLPRELVASHMAVQNQYRGHVDAALGMWLELGHLTEAQEIFMEDLAALYFGSPSSIQALKIQKVRHDLSRSAQGPMPQAPPGFRKNSKRQYVDFILLKLQGAGSSMPRREACSLLLDTLRLLDDFEQCAQVGRQEQGPDDSSPHWTDVLKQIDAVSNNLSALHACGTRRPGLEAVHKSLSETLLMLEARIKSAPSMQDNICLNQLADGRPANLQTSNFLVSDQTIHNCTNADLVRRAVDQTQLGVIPKIKA